MVEITAQDLRALLEAQRAAFMAEMPVSLAVRKDRMSREQSMLADIVGPIRTFRHALKHVDRWARNEKRKLDFPLGLLGAKAEVRHEPKGVVGVVSPWNFPVMLSFGPLVQALAAGNRVMLKPSEFTPRALGADGRIVAGDFDREDPVVIAGAPRPGTPFPRCRSII